MSLGFEQAGFDVSAAVEIDPVHSAIHKYNFPECAVLPQSVQDITGDLIREVSSIGDQKVDVVFGGAPCQGFSLIGQRVLDDPRNSLVKDFVRIVCELDASYFVFENVKGLTLGKHKKFLEELIETFETSGYTVRQEWRVLNAANYGVPQDRKRLFLLGAKKGLVTPVYPETFTVQPGKHSDLLKKMGPTCFEALDDLPDAEIFNSLQKSDEAPVTAWTGHSAYAQEMRCESPKAWHFGYKREWNPDLLTSSYRTEHSTISRTRFEGTEPGSVEPISRFFKLSPDGVSNTLRAGTDGARGAFICGDYAEGDDFGGMVGYIQKGTVSDWIPKIDKKLANAETSISNCLESVQFQKGPKHCYASAHRRESGREIQLIHVMLHFGSCSVIVRTLTPLTHLGRRLISSAVL